MVVNTCSLQKLFYLIAHLFVKSYSGVSAICILQEGTGGFLWFRWLAQDHGGQWWGSPPGLLTHSSVLFEDNKTKKLVPKGLISSALSHLQGNQPNWYLLGKAWEWLHGQSKINGWTVPKALELGTKWSLVWIRQSRCSN